MREFRYSNYEMFSFLLERQRKKEDRKKFLKKNKKGQQFAKKNSIFCVTFCGPEFRLGGEEGSSRAGASPPSVQGSREGGGFYSAFGMPQHRGAYGGFDAEQHQEQSTGGGGVNEQCNEQWQMAQHPQDTKHAQSGVLAPPVMQQEKLALAMQRQPHHADTQLNHLQTRALDGAAAGRGGAGRVGGVLGETPALALDVSPSVLSFGEYAPQNLRGTSDPQALDGVNDTVLWEDTVTFVCLPLFSCRPHFSYRL